MKIDIWVLNEEFCVENSFARLMHYAKYYTRTKSSTFAHFAILKVQKLFAKDATMFDIALMSVNQMIIFNILLNVDKIWISICGKLDI